MVNSNTTQTSHRNNFLTFIIEKQRVDASEYWDESKVLCTVFNYFFDAASFYSVVKKKLMKYSLEYRKKPVHYEIKSHFENTE